MAKGSRQLTALWWSTRAQILGHQGHLGLLESLGISLQVVTSLLKVRVGASSLKLKNENKNMFSGLGQQTSVSSGVAASVSRAKTEVKILNEQVKKRQKM